MRSAFPQNPRLSLVFAFVLLLAGISAFAQTTSPLEDRQSRAARAAMDQAALSADRIISILREEPGLLLQLKKTLIRKAYEQGRLLDPVDLTDAAIERLVRDDFNVRVLATQEIEARSYIRAKPTREEVLRDTIRKIPSAQSAAPPPATSGKTQEDVYWATHEEEPVI